MYKLILAFISLTLLSAAGVSQTKKTDREDAGLIGPVKSIQSKSADYSGDKILGEGFMKPDGDLIMYDESGRELDRKPVSDFGEAMGKMSRIFDKAGFLTEYSWVDPKGNLIKKDIYSYAGGRLAQTLTYNGALALVEKTVNNYDSRGRLEAENYYDPVRPVAKTIYKYDDKNNLVEVAFFMADGSKATAPVGPCLGAHRVTYEYGEKRLITARVDFEADGTKKKGYKWTYDDKGQIARYFIESASSTTSFIYKYEFDSHGNWTKRIATGTSLEKGLTVFGHTPTPYVRTTVTTRQISYF